MISPEEAFDPISFGERLACWENKIDDYLKKHYDGTEETIHFYFTDDGKRFVHIDQGLRELIVKRYRKVGWKVELKRVFDSINKRPLGYQLNFSFKKNWWK